MTAKAGYGERQVVVVIDAVLLAELLLEYGPKPILPALSYGRARIGYGAEARDEVERLLREKGEPESRIVTLLDELWRQGVELSPAAEVQAYEDEARDMGLRLAVASADPAIYLTADEGLAELAEWKGVEVVDSIEKVRQILLSHEDTAVVYRAASEGEALRVAEALGEAGIDAQVVSQQVPWYNGVLLVGQGYWGDVIVFAKDREEAAAVIGRLDM
jgi:hypothetical protein